MKERNALAAKRRRMPWMAVDKEYRFEGAVGELSLLDLFQGRRQLIVYRAFYGPEVTTYRRRAARIQSGGATAVRSSLTKWRIRLISMHATRRWHSCRVHPRSTFAACRNGWDGSSSLGTP
jgi:predicted dithiol-disulfide oxidoreductase (DUF899 family)